MAGTLINSMNTPFNANEYSDEYQGKLRALIEAKIAGKDVAAPQPESTGNVVDLMEALQKSVEKEQGKPTTKRTSRKKGA